MSLLSSPSLIKLPSGLTLGMLYYSLLMFLFFLVTGRLNDSLHHSLSSTFLVNVLLAAYKNNFVLLLITVVIIGVRKLR